MKIYLIVLSLFTIACGYGPVTPTPIPAPTPAPVVVTQPPAAPTVTVTPKPEPLSVTINWYLIDRTTVQFGVSIPNGGGSVISWDFGDRSAAVGISPRHAYPVGEWTIVVAIQTPDGRRATDSVQISITAASIFTPAPTPPPTPIPPPPPVQPHLNVVLFCTAAIKTSCNVSMTDETNAVVQSDQISAVTWDFGDGAVDAGSYLVLAQHLYPQVGSFTVTATVYARNGRQGVGVTSVKIP